VDGTRRRLLEAALVGFADRGYHGVSVREITAATGVKASSLYAHLASKEQLLLELCLLGHEEHRDGLQAALDGAGPDATDQLGDLVRAHVRFHAMYSRLATVCSNELHALSADGLAPVLAVRRDAAELVRSVLETGAAAGDFACPDPWLATLAITAMGMRVAAWYEPRGDIAALTGASWLRGPRTYEVEELCDIYAGYALRLVQ
jgi:AcrR family transcriptional regulator